MNKKILSLLFCLLPIFANVNAQHETILINGFTINIKLGNIIENDTDVIVNSANSQLKRGGGLCGQIFRRSQENGKLLKEICETKNKDNIDIADVVETDPCGLEKFKKIYHVIPPNFNKHNPMQSSIPFDEKGKELLEKCYENILKKAVISGSGSISIPFLSAGNFKRSFFDLPDMAMIAIESIKKFCKSNKNTNLVIDFFCFDPFTYELVMYPAWSKIRLIKLKRQMKKMVSVFRSMHGNMSKFEMSSFMQSCLDGVLLEEEEEENEPQSNFVASSLNSLRSLLSK